MQPLATGQCKCQHLTRCQDANEQLHGRRIHVGLLSMQEAHLVQKPLELQTAGN